MNKFNKKIVLIILPFLILLLVIVIVSQKTTLRKAPTSPGSMTTKDKDTGDTLVTDKNRTNETVTSGLVSIYGGDKVYAAMSDAQYRLLRENLTFYIKSNVANSVSTVKILPETIKASDQSVSFSLKTVNPEKILLIKCSLYNADSIQISYLSPDTNQIIYQTGYLPQDPGAIPTGD